MLSKKTIEQLEGISKRADEMNLLIHDKLSLEMDLMFMIDYFGGMRLGDLLKADKHNFTHDIVGIQNHINRATKEVIGCFVPRYVQSGGQEND